jgi:hypothetical protein
MHWRRQRRDLALVATIPVAQACRFRAAKALAWVHLSWNLSSRRGCRLFVSWSGSQ